MATTKTDPKLAALADDKKAKTYEVVDPPRMV